MEGFACVRVCVCVCVCERTLPSKNSLRMSGTADTSQDPIGPCGPLEQSVGDSCRHSTMADWSSVLDFGAHAVAVYYYRGHALMVRMGVRIMISVRGRLEGTGTVWVRVQSGGCS